MRLIFSSLAALALALPITASAQSQSVDIRSKAERVTGDALLEAYMGVTHEGAYNFTDAGRARGNYTETHRTDGKTEYQEGELDEVGAWVVKKDALCFYYPSMNGGCFRVWRVDNCYYYYVDGIPEREDEIDQDYWTARSVKQGEDATCEARFM